MLEQYGFLCDCQACTLTGQDRIENNKLRNRVLELDAVIERHLYEFEEESDDDTSADYGYILDEEYDKLSDINQVIATDRDKNKDEDEEVEEIFMAIKLLYHKFHLMDQLGFKVVSQVKS